MSAVAGLARVPLPAHDDWEASTTAGQTPEKVNASKASPSQIDSSEPVAVNSEHTSMTPAADNCEPLFKRKRPCRVWGFQY